MIRVLAYLNLEGAATFILERSFSKISEGKKFNLILIATFAIYTSAAWYILIEERSYVFDWSVKSKKQGFNCLGKQVPGATAILRYRVVLSLPCPLYFSVCKDHTCYLSGQKSSSNTELHLINLRREDPTGSEKTWNSFNIVMLSWYVKCLVIDNGCHYKGLRPLFRQHFEGNSRTLFLDTKYRLS